MTWHIEDSRMGGIEQNTDEARAARERVRLAINNGAPSVCPTCGGAVKRMQTGFKCERGCAVPRPKPRPWTVRT